MTDTELAWQNIENAEAEFLRNLAEKGGLQPLVCGMLRHCARLLDRPTTPQPSPAAHAGGEAVAVDALRDAVPSNWCDPLLTGPDGLGPQPWGCPQVERLLNGIRERITALLSGGAAREGRADNGDPETIVPAPPSRNRWTCKCGKVNPTFDPWCSACEEPQEAARG